MARGEDDSGRESKRRRHSSDEDSPRPRRRHDDDKALRLKDYSYRDRDSDRQRRRASADVSDEEARRRRRHRDRDHRRSPAREDRRSRRYDEDRDRDSDRQHRRRRSRSPEAIVRRSGPLPSQDASFALTTGEEPPVEKQKPNFAPTGLLAKEANTVQGAGRSGKSIVLKYHEPPEARKPPAAQAWRMYRFIGKDAKDPEDTLELGRRSCWLFGRENSVVDVLLEDPTTSKQHAVIQFRYSVTRDEFGDKTERVRPYLIDLESKAGTRLNGQKIEAGRYVELRDGDVVEFGKQDDDEIEEWVVMLPPPE